MKIKILEKADRRIRFIAEDTTPAFANALRRTMMGEIPILAVDTVDFVSNDSVLYNEIIAHRLAMIPLVFDQKDFHMMDEHEDGKTCSRCETVLVIDKKGPCMVYSKDMKSSNAEVKPLYGDIPIVELRDGQHLKLEASAILGLGKVHAKWQASRASYRFYPTAKLEGKIENPEDVAKISNGMIRIEGSKVTISEDYDLNREPEKVARPKGVLKIEGDPSRMIFDVESISGLDSQEIILKAVDILKSKAKELAKEAGKL